MKKIVIKKNHAINICVLMMVLCLFTVFGCSNQSKDIHSSGPMSILWTKKVERLCSFFEFLILLLLGCYVTNSTVYSFTVIPALYVFKNCPAGLC